MSMETQANSFSVEHLISEQRPVLGVSLIIVGSLLAVAAMPAVTAEDPILVAFFLPAFVAGAVGKFIGRFVQMYLRIIAGLIVFAAVFGFTRSSISLPLALGTAALNGLVCWAVAVRGAPRAALAVKG